jgi:type IV pilus assembly protein PilA
LNIPDMSADTGTTKSRGFSMLEMMAAVTVIAILGALALPSYLDRIARKQIEAAWPLTDVAKKPIEAFWAAKHIFPADNEAAGLPAADKIASNEVSAISVQDGAINITFGNRASGLIAGKVLTLRPAVMEDAPVVPVAWVCAKAEPPQKMTVRGIDKSNLPAVVLPIECRKLKP